MTTSGTATRSMRTIWDVQKSLSTPHSIKFDLYTISSGGSETEWLIRAFDSAAESTTIGSFRKTSAGSAPSTYFMSLALSASTLTLAVVNKGSTPSDVFIIGGSGDYDAIRGSGTLGVPSGGKQVLELTYYMA